MKATFIQCDLLDPKSGLWDLGASMDIIHVGVVLHLFDRSTQLEVMKRIIGLSREGTQVIGIQLGQITAGEVATGWGKDKEVMFLHDAESLKALWMEAGMSTGTSWTTVAVSEPLTAWGLQEEDCKWLRHDAIGIQFSFTRTQCTI